MLPFLVAIRAYLDGLRPGLFSAVLAALIFGALWLVRRFKPLLFQKLPTALQAWPAMVSGAVLAAFSTSSAGSLLDTVIAVLGNTLLGLTSGILAVGLHRTLKESPLPYGTNQIPPKAPADPSGPA